jgi:predicted metalloprotease with PDZ domain
MLSKMNKHLTAGILLSVMLWSCSSSKKSTSKAKNEVTVSLDLVNVTDDKVKVVVKPASITASTITYQLPKVIPGTYAVANYGKYIADFKALDRSGKLLPVTKTDLNTWTIANATQLASVEYWVNDTFDEEQRESTSDPTTKVIFSPAGTNILKGENFFLNLCGFVGYFKDQVDLPYYVTIDHPQGLVGTTALTDTDPSATKDVFQAPRYAEVVDNPIMYAKPDISAFTIGGMEVYLHVYSPRNKKVTSQLLLPALQKTMTAQKEFLGNINKNKKYAILVYLTSRDNNDAQGTGALEHNNSTSATFDDEMEADGLTHTISHEFFHTLTPLNVHSKEIHYFDFNQPKMSQHLWMYEGFTEYFSCLFKVNKGMSDEQSFYQVMMDKIVFSRTLYRDDISFTEMSRNVLDPVMNEQFNNVYNKGAAAAMCLDIMIREKSNGKRGILSVMGELSNIYGPNRPFDDDELIPQFTKITYPEVGEFMQSHLVKAEPIDYAAYLSKVGIAIEKVKEPVMIALTVDGKNYFRMDPKTNKAYIDTQDGNNEFLKAIGFENNDEIVELNTVRIEGSEAAKLVTILGYKLKEGNPYTAKVIRNGKTVDLNGTVKLNHVDAEKLRFTDASKTALKEQWLKN